MSRGVIVATEPFDRDALVELIAALDARGYDSAWLPELFGREPIATAGWLLGRTQRIAVATGIANVYVRDANAMAQARRSLAELSGGRFILGLGVSNAGLNAARGHRWEAPYAKLSAYLDAMDAAKIDSPLPAHAAPVYLAAHGPQLQKLAARRADGAITYLMPIEHARASRARVGADVALNVTIFCLAETDPDIARRKARAAIQVYARLDYYQREWRKLGYGDADFTDGGSDALIDALVAWGDADALRRRIAEIEAAGASRVVIVPLGLRTRAGIDLRVLDALAQR